MFAAKNTAAPSGEAVYIESVFSTYLYTGNGSTQTITNGIDLSGKGGMVWIKSRNDTYDHFLYDTLRGATKSLQSSTTTAEQTYSDSLTAFNSTGFALGANVRMNANTTTYASWTFREQAKFFDVVTYTGNGSSTQTINHNLGSVPGCIIIKVTSQADDWYVYHRSLSQSSGVPYWLNLNTTAAETFFGGGIMLNATPTSTSFTVKGGVNGNGNTYVAYLFAHDAGGFGPAGTDNVITCGSYTGNGSADGPSITLGYEAAWVMTKNVTTTGNWQIQDVMRGMPLTSASNLMANLSDAEDTDTSNPRIFPTATGFKIGTANARVNTSGQTYIYIAIRRGPMKTPTSGTSVFSPQTQTPTGSSNYVMAANSGFPVDWLPTKKTGTVGDWFQTSRLTNNYLSPNTTAAEGTFTYGFDRMAGVSAAWDSFLTVSYAFRRAPGFFDVVCYTGTGSTRTITHNLSVTPELVITKSRSQGLGWVVWTTSLTSTDYWIRLDDTMAQANSPVGYGGTFSASSYTIANTGPYGALNTSGATYVAYLFASVTGVSKVGSYTGNGSSQTINCGFTAGARFVMIKRTDSTGDWYVWDTARGIVSGNDPRLSINSTAAEVTTDDSIDPDNSGFIVNQLSATNINVSSATYIYLAIA